VHDGRGLRAASARGGISLEPGSHNGQQHRGFNGARGSKRQTQRGGSQR
jgi:hypothetical protein